MGEVLLSPQRITDADPSSNFSQTWSPGAANAFDALSLPVAKVHKAWERQPRAPRSNVAKYKKVWKTYGLRSAPDQDGASDNERESDRARAVKRMCVNGSTAPILPVIASKTRKNYAGTKFDRRKSGITRKTRVLRDMPSTDGAKDDAESADRAQGGSTLRASKDQAPADEAATPHRLPGAVRKKKSLGRHSLGANRAARRSFGNVMFGSIAEEPAKETMDALCLSPRKRARNSIVEADASYEAISKTEEDAAGPSNPMPNDMDEAEVQESGNAPEPVTETAENTFAAQVEGIPEENGTQSPEDVEERDDEAESQQVESTQDGVELADEDISVEATATTTAEIQEAEDNTTSQWADETTTHLDLDTALLKDFLSRTAAAKATRLGSGGRLSLPRRASLQNRRDSDAIRMALASPRKPLDDKDPNSPATSPAKLMDLPGVKGLAAQLDAITGGPLGSRFADGEDDDDDTTISGLGSRRSARQRSRLPELVNGQKMPNKISVKRTDGSDPVVVKKTEAQELSILTRSNTRRNKGTSLARLARLKKLRFDGMAEHWTEGKVKEMAAINLREDATGTAPQSQDLGAEEPGWKVPAAGEKGVRWRDQDSLLSYFGTTPNLNNAGATSAEGATSKLPPPTSLINTTGPGPAGQADIGSPLKRTQPARIRRLRGLGAANGTPGKGLLAPASLLPDEVAEEKERSRLAAPKERKSRIAAPVTKGLKPLMRGEDGAQSSMLRAPEVSVPKGLSMPAATSLLGPESREASEARERRLASPRKLPYLATGLAVPSAPGSRRRRA